MGPYVSSTYSEPWHKMEVTGKLHVFAVLPSRLRVGIGAVTERELQPG